MIRIQTFLISGVVLMFALSAGLTGCKGTTKAGTAYTVLPDRAIQAYLSGNLATVHQAAVKVLRDDFLYTITRDSHDALEGIVEAKTARNATVRVETFKHGEDVTKTRVSLGMVGDHDLANDILSKIEASLPSAEK
jgi:hypothetical protein